MRTGKKLPRLNPNMITHSDVLINNRLITWERLPDINSKFPYIHVKKFVLCNYHKFSSMTLVNVLDHFWHELILFTYFSNN